jgi:hypothetical protein
MFLTPHCCRPQGKITRRHLTLGFASLAIAGVAVGRHAAAANEESATPAYALFGTPSAQSKNAIDVRLAPGLGNEWCVYNGQLSADSLARIGEATIAGVRNVTGEGVVVIHWDRDGERVGPVSLGPDARSDAFNTMSVAGVWEAHVSGSEVNAPQRVTLEVEFTRA